MKNYSPDIGEVHGEELITDFSQTIYKSLRLDEILTKYKPETRSLIAKVIAKTIIECTSILKVPILQIKLETNPLIIEQKRQLPYTRLHIIRKTDDEELQPECFLPRLFLERIAGLIEESYLTDPLNFINKLTTTDELRRIMAHECYHLWEKKNTPRLASESYRDDSLEAWIEKRVEFAANMFAFFYVKNRKTFGFKDWILKFLAATQFSLDLEIFKYRRRILQKLDENKLNEIKKKPLYQV
ncbi:hypothetical protein GYA19_02860 [Candidatus Beckwithbacteria bacterium]|nr:hypothetical protein [Candidatus Beckwithbacteria bacterium]